MPRLRPEVLFRDGKLDADAWQRKMGSGACCEGSRCGSAEPAAAKAAFLARVEYRGALRQMMVRGWVADAPIFARKRDVLAFDAAEGSGQ